jgi:hypothetical protein
MEEAPAAGYREAIDLVGPMGSAEDIRWDERQRAWLVGSTEAFKEVASRSPTASASCAGGCSPPPAPTRPCSAERADPGIACR